MSLINISTVYGRYKLCCSFNFRVLKFEVDASHRQMPNHVITWQIESGVLFNQVGKVPCLSSLLSNHCYRHLQHSQSSNTPQTCTKRCASHLIISWLLSDSSISVIQYLFSRLNLKPFAERCPFKKQKHHGTTSIGASSSLRNVVTTADVILAQKWLPAFAHFQHS
jgi:hypothetical protein